MSGWIAGLEKALSPYPWAWTALMALVLVLVAWLANWITRHILLRGLRHMLRAAARHGVVHDSEVRLTVVPRLANVVPAVVIYAGVQLIPDLAPAFVTVTRGICAIFIVLVLALTFSRLLDLINTRYERRPDAHNAPIKGYLQVVKIIAFVLAGLAVLFVVAGAKFVHILTGVGASTAVLMLIFQDTILSLVASIQISNDGRIRIGDWIEMPGEGADGEVVDIALHTVTVQNWDKTITTIPTRKLISDSFKNWRGMVDSGGRRIKRAIWIDQNSVRFVDDDELARLERFVLLNEYLESKLDEINRWNARLAEHGAEAINRRRVTNLGTFRVYVEKYLRSHPGIHQGLTLMVRQRQPGEAGIPLEIYCFTSDVAWAAYENTQSDIFDHLLAILPDFGLRVFQSLSDSPMNITLQDARAGRVGGETGDGAPA